MKEKRMIHQAIQNRMPDFEEVRQKCLNQEIDVVKAHNSNIWLKRILPVGACAAIALTAIAVLPRFSNEASLSPAPNNDPTAITSKAHGTSSATTMKTNIVINQLDTMGDTANKLRTDVKFEEVEKDKWKFNFIDQIHVPDDLSLVEYNEVYTQPINPNGEKEWSTAPYSILSEYHIYYGCPEKSGRNIMLAFSKDFKPARDYYFLDDNMITSTIGDTSLIITNYEDSYMTQFSYLGMNFDIEFHETNEQEVIAFLTSFLS